MGAIRRALLLPASMLAWRLPGRPRRLLSAFSLAERGSMVDMLAAAEATPRRDMRRKDFLHALDEGRHARIFADRVKALGGTTRTEAALEDAGRLLDQGVVGGQTLFERFGERDFLAFVQVAEADAVEQFKVYIDHNLPDAETTAQLRAILKDEAFHVSYSKHEVDRYRNEGHPVDRVMRMIRLRRLWEGWLRFSRDFGAVMSGLWLGLLYIVLVAPFRLLARVEGGGWRPVEPEARDRLAHARAEG